MTVAVYTPADVMKEAYRDEYMVVTLDEAAGLVRAVRTSAPMTDAEKYVRVADELDRQFTRRERARLKILIDVRAAPMRSDEAFEVRMREIGTRMTAGWARHAMLVRTAVGMLQMRRQSRTSGIHYAIFDDEAAALAFLTAPESVPPAKK